MEATQSLYAKQHFISSGASLDELNRQDIMQQRFTVRGSFGNGSNLNSYAKQYFIPSGSSQASHDQSPASSYDPFPPPRPQDLSSTNLNKVTLPQSQISAAKDRPLPPTPPAHSHSQILSNPIAYGLQIINQHLGEKQNSTNPSNLIIPKMKFIKIQ